jgi:Ca2+-binding EF-hand superfamily protein
MKSGFAFGMIAVCLSPLAVAAEETEPFPKMFAQSVREGVTMEAFLQSVMAPFRAASGGAAALTRDMVDRFAARGEGAARINLLGQFIELDLDKDGTVTKQEAEARRSLPGGRITARFAETLFASDTDKNGSVSISEVYARSEPKQPDRDVALSQYLAFGDGTTVTAFQVMDRATRTFRSIDADGSTILSGEEIANVAARIPKDAKRQIASDLLAPNLCDFPSPSKNAETVLLGTYEGDAMADVHVGDPYDETTSSNITIQPGKTSLYIVVASYSSQIWVVSGAVERVEKLVAATPSGGKGSGVVGLAKDRVSLVGESGQQCIGYFYKPGTQETARAKKGFENAVGSDANHVAGIYSLSNVSVPDMSFEDLAPLAQSRIAPGDFDAESWKSGLRFTPRGMVRFDPGSVVAKEPAKAYEVMPQEFGLSQLVHTGQLVRLSAGLFRIARPIAQFPAGLAGSHAVRFVLGKGVPMPAGNPGHSCVVMEETGEPVGRSSAICRMTHPALDPEGAFK